MAQEQEGSQPLVVTFGDAVLDIIAQVSPSVLQDIKAEQGGCVPVDQEEMSKLLQLPEVAAGALRLPGGSAANVGKAMAGLAGGGTGGTPSVRYIGQVGRDAPGDEYRTKLLAAGVEPVLSTSDSGAPTAACLCLVTPGGQRTMRTCLGAALELRCAAQLPAAALRGAALLHCEGYSLYRPDITAAAMRKAAAQGARVSLDLAAFEVVRNCWEALRTLLQGGAVQVVFCNEQEAHALCEAAGLAPADGQPDDDVGVEAAQRYLLQYCKLSVVSLGPRGCVARAADGTVARAAGEHVPVVDTVGAGDYFTGGFLHAWLRGAPLQVAAAAGCAAGGAAVQSVGAALDEGTLAALRQRIAAICAQPAG